MAISTPDGVEGDALLQHYADTILATRPGPLWLVGHSMGGAAALVAARTAPERVRAVILVGSARRLPVNPTLLTALDETPDEAKARITRWSLARGADARLRAESDRMMGDQDAGVIRRQFAACASFDMPTAAIPPSVHLGAVVGAEDRMTPPDLVAELRSWRPDAPVVTLPGAGHLVMLEAPDAFNAALHEILTAWELV